MLNRHMAVNIFILSACMLAAGNVYASEPIMDKTEIEQPADDLIQDETSIQITEGTDPNDTTEARQTEITEETAGNEAEQPAETEETGKQADPMTGLNDLKTDIRQTETAVNTEEAPAPLTDMDSASIKGTYFDPENGFEGFPWGTEIDAVKEYLDEHGIAYIMPFENNISIMDATDICGLMATRSMRFEDGTLSSGTYWIENEYADPEGYYQDYLSLIDQYTQMYGDPVQNMEKRNETDPGQGVGQAIREGKLDIVTRWKDEMGNGISMTIAGENSHVSTVIRYAATKQKN